MNTMKMPADTRHLDQADIDLSLQQKIDALLSSDENTPPSAERSAVAVLLSLRLPIIEAIQVFQKHSWIVAWIIMLIENDDENETDDVEKQLYVRLAAQVLGHVPSVAASADLAKILMRQLDAKSLLSAPISAFDIDIVSNLSIYLDSVQGDEVFMREQALTSVWKRWSGSVTASTLPVNSKDLIDNAAQETMHSWYQVLEQLLHQQSAAESSSTEEEVRTMWNDQVMTLLQAHLSRVTLTTSSCFQLMLQYWLSKEQQREEKQHQVQIASILLECLLVTMTAPLDDTKDDLLQSPLLKNHAPDILHLITACLISTSKESDQLRVLAWTCVSQILDTINGWQWLLQEAATSDRWTRNLAKPKHGKAQHLCTTLRLASGEYKIQLGRSHPQIDTLVATSQVLVRGLDFMVHLLDSGNESLLGDSDSILHVRFSFREGLDACVQYLCFESSDKETSSDVLLIVIRLFAALLSEFLEFEDNEQEVQKPGNKKQQDLTTTRHQPIQVLPALRQALDLRGLELQQSLLPALLTVLVASEEDENRINQLKASDILGDPLTSFLCAFFEFGSNIMQVDLAAQVIEQWYEMVTSVDCNVTETHSLQDSIYNWIEAILKSPANIEQDDATVAVALGSAVAYYVTLQGEERPTGPHAHVLERALKFCSICQSESGFV
ncbi:hypothetical protein MPSEU_000093100 [Mayamaea pseudoterrestris]|nr:hypothetical protein MPSEU_000093100 [Mayamaea pseudoterrestris]